MRCAPEAIVTTRSVTWPSSRPVSAKWPRWFVPIWVSKPSLVRASGTAITPALLIRASIGSSQPSANARTAARSVAAARPMPLVAPVISTVWPSRFGRSLGVHLLELIAANVVAVYKDVNDNNAVAVNSTLYPCPRDRDRPPLPPRQPPPGAAGRGGARAGRREGALAARARA